MSSLLCDRAGSIPSRNSPARVGLGECRRRGRSARCRPPRRRCRAARRPRPRQRARADRRQVGAAVLPGLDQLDQHAAAARACAGRPRGPAWRPCPRSPPPPARCPAAPRSPGRHPRPPAPRTTHGTRDVGPRLASGATRPQHAGRADRLRQHLVRAQHPEPLLAQHADDRGQQPVIAGEGGAADAGQQPAPSASGRRSSRAGGAPGRPAPGPGSLWRRSAMMRRRRPAGRPGAG